VSSPSGLGENKIGPFSTAIIIFDDLGQATENNFIFGGIFVVIENKLLFYMAHRWPPKIRLFSVGFFIVENTSAVES
jgi:hypothetical protein